MLGWFTRWFGTHAPEPQRRGDSRAPEIPPGAYVIGRTKDLLKFRHVIAPDDPRRSLFVYHELRQKRRGEGVGTIFAASWHRRTLVGRIV